LKYILEDYSVQCEYDTTQNLLNVTIKKEVGGCRIFTVPVLIVCQCQREQKTRLEQTIKDAGIRASFQWPKGMIESVAGMRGKVARMGFKKEKDFNRIKPIKEGEGYGSTDLRLYTSTKLKIVNYWLYSLMHKNQNLYLNNI
jgi:hypothetical protein